MLKFFNKHPVIAAVIISLSVGLAKGGYTYFTDRPQQLAGPTEVRQAMASLSSQQIPLAESDVLAAIRLFAILPKKNKTAAQPELSSQLSLGIIGQANAANFSAKEYRQLLEQAGFKNPAKVSGVLVSVVLAAISLQFDALSPSLADDIRKVEKMAADPKITGSAKAKIDRNLQGLKRLEKLIGLMSGALKPLPENIKLVKRHQAAINRSMGIRG